MKLKYKLYLFLVVVLILFSECNTDELAALNVNPTTTTEIDWRYLFTNGLLRTGGNTNNYACTQLTYCAPIIQHLSILSTDGGDKYFAGNGLYFNICYSDILKNYVEVIKQTGPDGKDPQLVNLYNAARVMKVFVYHRCTDLYGDIPYFEANKAYDEGIFFPAYDTQQDIYMDMLNELTEAATGFDNSADDMNSQDLIYNGNVDQWKKFAYSLMLRLAMRISNVEASTARSYVEKAIEGGVFTSNEDNAWIPMASGPNRQYNTNEMSVALQPGAGGDYQRAKPSKTLIDFLRDNNDPRLMIITSGIGYFGNPDKIVDPALQKGLPNGHDQNTIKDYEGVTGDVDVDTTYSRVNEMLIDWDDPALLQTYAEVEFLLAEAAVKGWHSGYPDIHYNNGVRAAMQMYDIFDPSFIVSDAEVDAYLATHPYDPAKGPEMISTQYWAATFLNFYEAFANWRRTEFPVLIPHDYPGNATNGTIPRRMMFDLVEVSKNEANYLAAMERMGGDKMTTRVWWDGGN